MSLGKQNVMKLEVFILSEEKKGWGRGRSERIEKESREMIKIERKDKRELS